MTRTWTAVLARIGTPTGDKRIIAPGALTSRDLPLPLMWQRVSDSGHGGAVTVGAIETMTIDNESGMVTATGSWLPVRGSSDAQRQAEAGVTGPSVDLFDDVDIMEVQTLVEAGVVGPNLLDNMDDIEYAMDDDGMIVITRARIAGATLVQIPAFAGVSIAMADRDCDPATEDCSPISNYAFALGAFSVRSSGWSDMPIADEGRAWDGDAAADRVFAWAGGEENISWSKYARAFLRKDDDANPETRGAYGFGIADVIDGTLTIVPRGVFAAAAAVQGARTGKTPEDAEAMKRVLGGIYGRLDREAPFSLAASAAAPVLPPLDWFRQPDLDRLTPLTVSDNGRVFGHIAGWGQCHIGLPGCVTAPASQSGYSYFHVAEQATADGPVLPVGTLVAGPRHADPQAAFQAAQSHYDVPGAAVARVMAGEDEHGIWVAGWMLPGATEEAKQVFRSSPVSGDWRRVGGSLELIAVCSVNAPGFPVPRARVAFSNGAQRTLIGSFGITPQNGEYAAPVPVPQDQVARWRWAMAQTGTEAG